MGQKEDTNEIVVREQKISTKIENVDIYALEFWKENPRVNSVLKREFGNTDVSDSQIEDIMWRTEPHVKDLYQDIKRQGGLIDEILVKGNIVLEGNSRLCAYRKLHKKAIEKEDPVEIAKWSKIRARIIPEDTSQDVIFTILGTWHIRGKQHWDTFEKAAYLKRMKEDFGYSVEDIAEMIGEPKSFVENNISAHDLMVEHKVFDLEKFSHFFELIKNRKITNFIDNDPETKDKVVYAIINDQFSRAEEVRDLPKILGDKVAKREFFEDKSSLQEALEISKERNPEYDDSFYSHIKKTTRILQSCSLARIDEIKSDHKKTNYVKMLFKESERLWKKVDPRN
jgi:disulfide oxidoreductase YuzD